MTDQGMTKEDKFKAVDIYLNLIYKTLDVAVDNFQNFNKGILTLSSAALGLVFSFLRELLFQNISLKIAVMFFVGSIVLTILSFPFSNWELIKIMKLMSENMNRQINGNSALDYKKSWRGYLSSFCGYSSGIFFVLAVILVTYTVLKFGLEAKH